MRETVAGAPANEVYNTAFTTREHCGCDQPTGVEGSAQIDLNVLPPDLGITLPDRPKSAKGAMVVDKQVDGAKLGGDPIKHLFDGTAVNHIPREGDGDPAFFTDQRHGLIYVTGCPRQNGDLGAVSRLMQCDLTSDSAPGTCDQRNGF